MSGTQSSIVTGPVVSSTVKPLSSAIHASLKHGWPGSLKHGWRHVSPAEHDETKKDAFESISEILHDMLRTLPDLEDARKSASVSALRKLIEPIETNNVEDVLQRICDENERDESDFMQGWTAAGDEFQKRSVASDAALVLLFALSVLADDAEASDQSAGLTRKSFPASLELWTPVITAENADERSRAVLVLLTEPPDETPSSPSNVSSSRQRRPMAAPTPGCPLGGGLGLGTPGYSAAGFPDTFPPPSDGSPNQRRRPLLSFQVDPESDGSPETKSQPGTPVAETSVGGSESPRVAFIMQDYPIGRSSGEGHMPSGLSFQLIPGSEGGSETPSNGNTPPPRPSNSGYRASGHEQLFPPLTQLPSEGRRLFSALFQAKGDESSDSGGGGEGVP